MAKSKTDCHVAFFPFPFTSHPRVMFNLARDAAKQLPQVLFSFISIESCINSLLSSPENHSDHLPKNIKSYTVHDFNITDMSPALLEGIEEAEKETGRKLTCVVTDAFFSAAVAKIVRDMNIPSWVAVWVASPYCLSAHLYTFTIREMFADSGAQKHQKLDSIPGLSRICFSDLPKQVLPENEVVPDTHPHYVLFRTALEKMGLCLPEAAAVVLNSYEEINSTSLTNDLNSKFQNSLHVGFLSLPVPLHVTSASGGGDETGCIPWLDKREPASVAYIAFGTVTTPTPEENVALTLALEESGISFLWSLKDESVLPEGFLDRTRMQGKVVPWAPQSRILSHKSVGVHVTHAGYNSVCESILCGVPMICRPMWADNHMIARMVDQEWKIGVRVEDGVITKDDMVKCFKRILEYQEGKRMRDSINALKQIVLKAAGPEGSAARHFKTLLQIFSQNLRVNL